jgi:hypothetical protein
MKLYIRPTADGEIGDAMVSDFHDPLASWLEFDEPAGFSPKLFYIDNSGQLKRRLPRPLDGGVFDRTTGEWEPLPTSEILRLDKTRKRQRIAASESGGRSKGLRAFGYKWDMVNMLDIQMAALAALVDSSVTSYALRDLDGVLRTLTREQILRLPAKYLVAMDNRRSAREARFAAVDAATNLEALEQVAWQEP